MPSGTLKHQVVTGMTGAIDIGATKILGVAQYSGRNPSTWRAATADFQSFRSVITAYVLACGGDVPEALVVDVAGHREGNIYRLTNADWPSFRVDDIEAEFGCQLEIYNDLQLAVIGLTHANLDRLPVLKLGLMPASAAQVGVATDSTGVNDGVGMGSGAALPLARESGWMMPGLPPRTELSELLAFVDRSCMRELHRRAGWEDLLGGKVGVENVVDFCMEGRVDSVTTSPALKAFVADYRRQHGSVAPLMTRAVMGLEAQRAVRGQVLRLMAACSDLHSAVLGWYLKSCIEGNQLSELAVQGSVLAGTPGYAQHVARPGGPFMQALMAPSRKVSVTEHCRILLVPNSVNLAVIGGLAMARGMARL